MRGRGCSLHQPREVIVIGAGPAGAYTALLLARAGVSVSLVERKPFPRSKVCGGCLNPHAVRALSAAGLLDRVMLAGARSVSAIHVHHAGKKAVLPLSGGIAVTRAVLDQILVDAAVEAGCDFVPETTALVSPEGPVPWRQDWRRVTLQHRHEKPVTCVARAVVVADGLAHSSLRECVEFRSRVWRDARIGVGATVEAGAVPVTPGTITMAIAPGGYVGAVEAERGRIVVAAAVDAGSLRISGSAAAVVSGILAASGIATGPGFDAADWSGTIPLTRAMRRPAGRRVLVLGDAAGYVEPFTGEGMAWALTAGRAVVPFVREGLGTWTDGLERRWVDEYRRVVRRQQWWSRALARSLRHPWITRGVMRVLHRHPGLARPVIAHLSNPRD